MLDTKSRALDTGACPVLRYGVRRYDDIIAFIACKNFPHFLKINHDHFIETDFPFLL